MLNTLQDALTSKALLSLTLEWRLSHVELIQKIQTTARVHHMGQPSTHRASCVVASEFSSLP